MPSHFLISLMKQESYSDLSNIRLALPFHNLFDHRGAAVLASGLLSLRSWAIGIDGGMNQLKESCPSIPLCNILKATYDFDDALVIGTGGFGKVYKGIIDMGATTTFVAIKRLNVESKQGAEEFWTEVKLLSKFQHTNLVALIGYCDENQEMILVYEYIASGTLANHLYKTSGEESGRTVSHLTWIQRLKICLDAARGLDYLHNGTGQGIIHRDVKSTNILLDEHLVAKVSDFGLSKNIVATHVSTNVKGTIGYLDPDYFFTNRLTKKSDVYSLGVVLLEVLCGRPPVDVKLEEEKISLILWAKMYIKKGKLDRIIDPSLNGETPPQSLKYFAKLANNCLHTQPKERPTMSEVVEILENALASLERKRRSQGTIAKAYQGIKIVPKGMNRWWGEGKGNNSNDSNDDGGPSKHPFPENFSLAEICAATENFNKKNLLSRDFCSKLYKGFVAKGSPAVVIRRFEEASAKIQLQSQARHPNIMSLIGLCREGYELILVHDYMVNGTLRSHIDRTHKDPLPWKKRLEICIDVAQGLKYLHTNVEQQLIGCCVKPSNVFLDDNWVAKVAAFERSIPIPAERGSEGEGMEITVLYWERTWNYLDPYQQTFELTMTKESEVYAFGVILLEVLFSNKHFMVSKPGGFNATMFRYTVDEVIDPYLVRKIAPECFSNYVNLAQSCLDRKAIRRPSMDDVLHGLQSSLQMQKAWESSVKKGAMFRGLQSLSWPTSPEPIRLPGQKRVHNPRTEV